MTDKESKQWLEKFLAVTDSVEAVEMYHDSWNDGFLHAEDHAKMLPRLLEHLVVYRECLIKKYNIKFE